MAHVAAEYIDVSWLALAKVKSGFFCIDLS